MANGNLQVGAERMTPPRQLHLTVGSASGLLPAPDLGLADDLRLLKAALLYADRVTLCSVGSSVAVNLLVQDAPDEAQMLDIVEWRLRTDWRPFLMRQFTLDRLTRYRSWRENAPLRPPFAWQQPDLFSFGRHWKREWSELRDSVLAAAQSSDAHGLEEAVDTGLLEIRPFPSGSPPDQLVNRVNEEFFFRLREAVVGGGTYPLLDEEAWKLVRWCTRRGTMSVSEPHRARTRHGALAFELLRRPLFEEASVEEILNAREELEGPLVRFRSAVVGFSEGIVSAGWDADFPLEAEHIFLRDVEPAVLEVREAVEESASLHELATRAVRPADLAAGLGLMMASLEHLPGAAAVALGASVTAAGTLRSAYKDWRDEKREIEGNRMFFYYGAGERLASARSGRRTPRLRR